MVGTTLTQAKNCAGPVVQPGQHRAAEVAAEAPVEQVDAAALKEKKKERKKEKKRRRQSPTPSNSGDLDFRPPKGTTGETSDEESLGDSEGSQGVLGRTSKQKRQRVDDTSGLAGDAHLPNL